MKKSGLIFLAVVVAMSFILIPGCSKKNSSSSSGPSPANTPVPGSSWTQAAYEPAFTYSARVGQSGVEFSNAMWVIAGFDGNYLNDVWYSSDGANWGCTTTAAAFTARALHSSLVYNNFMWVIAGEDISGVSYNDVWRSSNGADWAQATGSAAFLGRYAYASIVYNNQMWVIAGQNNGMGNQNDV